MNPARPETPPERPRRAALLVTCLVDLLFPRIGRAAAAVLLRLGVEPVLPRSQTCCGQPALNAGYRAEARSLALHFLDGFEAAEAVVAPSGSCAAMVREQYPRLFEDEPDLARRFAALGARTYELSQFITDVLRLDAAGGRFRHPVTYHDSCHSLRSLGLRDGPRRLIRAVEGVELRELPDAEVCCGFGGTFAVKYPEISLAMAEDKAARIESTGADFVVATDQSCLMHLGGLLQRRRSRVRTLHLAELLAMEE